MTDYQLLEVQMQPGLYTEQTDRGARNRWVDGDKIRFRKGIPETIGGWVTADESNTLIGVARAVHDWVDLSGGSWTAFGTNEKLYLWENGNLYNITPLDDSGTLTDPFTTTNGSADVTVTDTSHGRSVDDRVFFSNATAVGGVTIDGEYVVQSVTDANNYVITHSSAATSSATGGGSVDYEYEISVGTATKETLKGWGTAGYGEGGWGEPTTTNTSISQRNRIWSLDNWGEDLIATARGGDTYVWDKSAGVNNRASSMTNAPQKSEWMLVTPETRHVMLFGAYSGSAQDFLLVRWSDREDYTVWTAASTNRAGDLRLVGGSRLITALMTRREIVAFSDTHLHSLQFVGGQLEYGSKVIGGKSTVAGPNAAVEVGGVVMWMGSEDFYVYDGVVRVLPCDVRNHVFGDFNDFQSDNVFAAVNRDFTEVWWFYPSSGSEENDRYVIYNYAERNWSFGTLERTCFHDRSFVFRKPYGTDAAGTIFKHEEGFDGDGAAIGWHLETSDMEIGSGDKMAQVKRVIPDMLEQNGDIDLTLKVRQYPQSTQRSKGPYTLAHDSDTVAVRARGRQVAFRFSQDITGARFRLGTFRAYGTEHGRR